jgi:glutamine synthetase
MRASWKYLKQLSGHLQEVYTRVNDMVEHRKIANNMDNTRTKAIAYLQ